ncbi:protein LTV1-like protein [Dinothrombium tinctorium]|uniref:Protein LTV1 homolog n=1 Tax=Dinothrombium tinctorium TaxID=1965070 RepID=A0A443RNQ4_9ACAR|nr:protein LTV1-like protein [Dinothrombium tinctorium]
MGKTRRRIDKKNAITFKIVSRSQKDPLIADESAPQHVWVECGPSKQDKSDVESRKAEQRKFGIYFDDDYDYLQHLKGVRQVDTEWQKLCGSTSKKSEKKVMLPSSLFASGVEEEEGMLNKAALPVGPQPDWDPDIVAAMDEDFDFDDPQNIIDDDFVNQAMEGNSDSPHESDEGEATEDEEDEEEEDEESDVISFHNDRESDEFSFEKEERKSHFTNYSMTSSVIRRNEKLKLLDERFETLYEKEYADDTAIGALDLENIEGTINVNESALIKKLIAEKEAEKAKDELELNHEKVAHLSCTEEGSEYIEINEDTGKNNKDRFDCESILSTYSNLYNHPKLIKEDRKLKIDPKTGIPVGVFDKAVLSKKNLKQFESEQKRDDLDDCRSLRSSIISEMSVRPKNETPEERKARKEALKEYKRERREEKKANKTAFKLESQRQNKEVLNLRNRLKAVKLV